MANSLVAGVYEKVVDRESAYEKLKAAHAQAAPPMAAPTANFPASAGTTAPASPAPSGGGIFGSLFQKTSAHGDSIAATMAKSLVRSMSSSAGSAIVRGVLGSLFGGRRR